MYFLTLLQLVMSVIMPEKGVLRTTEIDDKLQVSFRPIFEPVPSALFVESLN